jgi:hypothetical protein
MNVWSRRQILGYLIVKPSSSGNYSRPCTVTCQLELSTNKILMRTYEFLPPTSLAEANEAVFQYFCAALLWDIS